MTPTIDKNAYASLLAEFQPQVITTEEENERALSVVEKLMAMRNRTPEQNALLNLLVILIEKFEDEHYQLNAATPQSILLHLMEARGVRQEDLIGVIGSRGVVSEVVNGKRSISKAQAKALAEFFHVSAELFI
ncbi:helix-turn-helix domain-containing protein [Chroococcidiopsis sp. CCMEE 29]|uniref:helix-turn-helix domain-containing protein n=1 Tax=Chroococcidiopsis sp. CCMEE 29 TaxID=155894 RepID=UPI0020222B85|nr:helix-turn-helix domain-containing protein [Chroococcidiopsis sp. CCMEE 29]